MVKKYIIDTCVLLHDPQSIFKFDEHSVYIPLAVIDDLDEQKTRKGSVGWAAREVFRIIDKLNIKELTNGGAILNEQNGRAFIYNPDVPLNEQEIPEITKTNSDNAIINCCLNLQKKYEKDEIIIVTKDIGLRVRAESWGCKAENYKHDLIEDNFYTGIRYINIDNNSDWDILWSNDVINLNDLSFSITGLYPNEFIIFNWGENKCPAIYKKNINKIKILKDKSNNKSSCMGIVPHNIEQKCALEILQDNSISMVSIAGPAGVGKTILSLAVALEKTNEGVYDKIVLIKPIIPVGGQDIGALPGDKLEKLYHWFGPFRDNIQQLIGGTTKSSKIDVLCFDELVENNIIEVEAMTYIQGRSIPNSIIITDEAQNVNVREARMIVERCGKNSKIILLGDLSQVENPYLDNKSCGLAHAMNGSKTKDECACITLNKVERSSLAAIASEIFKNGAD